MLKRLNINLMVIGLVLILLITSYFLFIEDIESTQALAGLLVMTILSIFVLSNKKIAIYSIIALAPISIPIYFEVLSLELSFPTEFTTLLLIVTLGTTLFLTEKFDKKILFHPISILLFLDLAFTLLAVAFSTLPLVSGKRFLLKLGFVTIYYFVFSHWYSNSENKKSLYFLYAIGLIYPIYSALKWHSMQDFSVASSFAVPQPYYSDHTIYGACLAFILPFLIAWIHYNRKEKKGLLFVGVVLLTIMIMVAEVLSYSRASWISLFAVVLFRVLLHFKVAISQIVISVTILFSILFYNYETIYNSIKKQETEIHTEENISDHLGSVTNLQTDASNLERINRWTCAIRMFNEKPLTGFGPGTYQFEYGQFQSIDTMTRISTHEGDKGNAHSEYLTYLSEYGLFAFILFLILVFYTVHVGLKLYYFFRADRSKRVLIFGALAGLTTFFVHGLFNSFIDSEKMAILVYGSLALLVIFDLERRKMMASKQ